MATGPNHQQSVREQVEDEAASWLLRMAEDPNDPRLRDEVSSWRQLSPLHQEIWDRTCAAYDVFGQVPRRHESQWKPHGRPVRENGVGRRRHRRVRPRRILALAGLAALAACIAFITLPGLFIRLGADHVTATAEVRTLALEDGSRIHLGPRSAVDVVFSDRVRTVRLLSGEGFFEVVRDQSRPFTVTANDVVTTVIGTKFDVRLHDTSVSVAVKEGHVRVSDPRRDPPVRQDLLAGDSIRVGAGGVIARTAVDPADIGDWSEGRLVARHRPVAEIVDRLRDYYGGLIVLNDRRFAALEVSGVYDPADPVTTLENLAKLHGARLRQVSPWLVFVTPY